jgi:uncharacterized protein (TIGR03437 family)
MRYRWLLLLIAPLLWAQSLWTQSTALPIFLGQTVGMLPPAIDASGRIVLFGSSITPDGASTPVADIYVANSDGSGLRRLTKQLFIAVYGPSGADACSVSPDGAWAAYTAFPVISRGEEVHLLDVTRGTDKTVAVDTEGCIQPLATVCVNCFFSCVNTPHVAADGSYVLYMVRRNNPFWMARADGSKPTNLPIYSGVLAGAPRRVISSGGLVVFTSNAPNGPTFAAAATDVYLMKLDGTGLQNVTRFKDSNTYTSDATISADGSTIAFLQTQLFVIAADGSNLRQITSGTDTVSAPSLSADGSRVAYAAKGQIFVAATSAKTPPQQITSFKNSTAGDPVISDDGTRVAFTVGPLTSGRGAIYSVASDGSALRAVYAPRSLNSGPFYGLVAGSLASLYGTNFSADSITGAASLPLTDTLAGVSLTMNGIALPMLAVSPWQVNFHLPPGSDGLEAFELRFTDGFRSTPVAATVQAYGPDVYLIPSIRYNQAAALHGNSAVVVGPDNPAVAGEAIQIYASGLGPTNPVVAAGTAAPSKPLALTLSAPKVSIGGRDAQVLFSGLAPGLVGVYQVNVVVPAGLRAGDNFVSIQIAGVQASGGGMISVKQ